MNLVHDRVVQPLKSLLECLQVPAKLIEKRHDKMLDYEFAKSNVDKFNKERYFIKTVNSFYSKCGLIYRMSSLSLLANKPYIETLIDILKTRRLLNKSKKCLRNQQLRPDYSINMGARLSYFHR
jgi:hypothetical protein